MLLFLVTNFDRKKVRSILGNNIKLGNGSDFRRTLKSLKWQVLQVPIILGVVYLMFIVLSLESEVKEFYTPQSFSFYGKLFTGAVQQIVLVLNGYHNKFFTFGFLGFKHDYDTVNRFHGSPIQIYPQIEDFGNSPTDDPTARTGHQFVATK